MANRVFSSQNLTEVTFNSLIFCLIETMRSANWPVMLIILNSLLLSANKPCLNLTDSTKWFSFGTTSPHSRTNSPSCFDNELSEVKQPIFFIWDKGGHLTEYLHVMEPYCKLRHELRLVLLKLDFSFFRYGFEKPAAIIELWLRTLLSLAGWASNRCILFIVDVICREAFCDEELRAKVKAIFAQILEVRHLSAVE